MSCWKTGLTVIMACGAMCNAVAFYDATVETHANVKNVKADFGAVADGVTDDSAAFQAAIDWISANGGGDLIVPYDPDGYTFKSVNLKSNVHLLIDANTELTACGVGLSNKVSMLAFGDTDAPVINTSVRGVGGRFVVHLPPNDSVGTSFMALRHVTNFLLSDFDIHSNNELYSALGMAPSGFNTSKDEGYPTQGTIQNCSAYNTHYGYGLIQVQAADTVRFENLYGEGGATLRFETGWVSMNLAGFGGVHDVYATNIRAKNAKVAVMLGPHAFSNGVVTVDGVVAESCGYAVTVGAGSNHKDALSHLPPGVFGDGTSIKNVTATYGTTARLKWQDEQDVPPELQHLIGTVSPDGGKSVFGPSIAASKFTPNYVASISNVKAYGYDYTPPVQTAETAIGDGFSEEPFTDSAFSTNLNSYFWSVNTNLNAGGTNWLSGNGSSGILDSTVAVNGSRAVNYTGFVLGAGTYVTVASDFRFYHEAGGKIEAHWGEPAFGLMVSTDPHFGTGTKVARFLANRGNGLSTQPPLEGYLPYFNLGVDLDAGGWSDWFRMEWAIEPGTVTYQGTLSLYDDSGNLLFVGSRTGLGIPNGTELFAGYIAGSGNMPNVPVASYSKFGGIEVDNFKFERMTGTPPVCEVPDDGWNEFVAAYLLYGSRTVDEDDDGQVDYGEYVFGGSPVNSEDIGVLPVFDAVSSNYIFSLFGDNRIVAHVLTNADLVAGSWGTNETVSVTENSGILGAYTNTVGAAADRLFFKLLVE